MCICMERTLEKERAEIVLGERCPSQLSSVGFALFIASSVTDRDDKTKSPLVSSGQRLGELSRKKKRERAQARGHVMIFFHK